MEKKYCEICQKDIEEFQDEQCEICHPYENLVEPQDDDHA